jgi:4-amino-4-deoxy-L-arabinose transferase-like glycosyltransferase
MLKKWNIKIPDWFFVFFPTYFVYLLTIYPTVGTEDSGELIVSAATLDIAHPPGYPLHTLLGKLFTWLIPFGNIGWRVNLMSAFFGAATIALVYLLIRKLVKNDYISMGSALLLGFSDIFWSQSIRTETYTLHTFTLISIVYLLYRWHETEKNKFLFAASLATGLGLANQHALFLAGIPIIAYVLIKKWKVIISPKIVAGSLLALFLGLCVYAYLPIRTSLGPYDNPAYIKHEGLHTWDTFINFVNRKIYGGTINVTEEPTEQIQGNVISDFFITVGDTFGPYVVNYASNNVNGLFMMLRIIFQQLFFIPIIAIAPGFYYLGKKHKKFTILLGGLFFFYTSVQLLFINVNSNLHPYTLFSNRPFYMSSIIILTVICACGIAFILDIIENKKLRTYVSYAALLIPFIPLAVNFSANNESHNYLAHDFGRNLLESLPPNAFMITTGKDNVTFPLYYLRKIENIRPDIDLEVYYGRDCVDENLLENRLIEKQQEAVFIDLLPCKYSSLNLEPYNFVYAYGNIDNLPPEKSELYNQVRGIKPRMDYMNNRIKGLYYLKLAIEDLENEDHLHEYFTKTLNEVPEQDAFKWFIDDFYQGKDTTGMF